MAKAVTEQEINAAWDRACARYAAEQARLGKAYGNTGTAEILTPQLPEKPKSLIRRLGSWIAYRLRDTRPESSTVKKGES